MTSINMKKLSGTLVALFLATILVMTTPAQAAYLDTSTTAVSGGTSTVAVTVQKENPDMLNDTLIANQLQVNLTYPNGTTVTLTNGDATVTTSGTYTYGYGYQVPGGSYGYGYGYGVYGGSSASVTYTWSLSLDDGTYTVTSALSDATGDTHSFSVEESLPSYSSSGTTGTTGGAVAPTGETYTLDFPGTASLGPGDSGSFTVGGEEHRVDVVSIGVDYVILDIFSDPVRVTVSTGEDENVDIDGDGEYDLVVYLSSITDGKANLEFSEYVAPTEDGEEVTGEVVGEEAEEAEPTEPMQVSETAKLITGIVVVVAILGAIGWYLLKERR